MSPEPDIAAEYADEDPRTLTGPQRDQLAEAMGKSRAYVDRIIDEMGAAFDDIDPDHDRDEAGP